LPLSFFRRKTETQARNDEAAPLAADPEPAAPPADEAPEAIPARPKRRRGSRGGRGRRKPADAAAAAAAQPETVPKAAAKAGRNGDGKAVEKPERKPRPQRSQSRRRTATKRSPLPRAKRELLISVDAGERRVAVLEDGRVAEVYLERPERRSIAGDIYLGVVDNVLPGMEAAFVEMGLEKNGFLYVDEIVGPELEGRRHGKRIQDLISRGQEILVQAVKDPMKTKGARLTTDISLPGRFVVYVPNGEGLGVSRRLEEDERNRLRDILKALDLPSGGVIVRTAAEGASAEDIERDLVFLQRLWKTIQARAKQVKAPSLVYQEAELPLRVTRDLFAGDFERALVDHDRTYKRVVGYLKKTSPHMAERVERYKDKTPLFEAYGVDAEIRSTLSRRVDLPSGGYLVFDYAEAFTVIDVNTGRFVGSRSKSSTQRLEDTITKNNLEAVAEVVRQLRLRDIGGIIVIDFIDMANPRNRAAVEEALRTELERDRTKTYVVEISPLGLVEMTRQNVTDGPREILTRKCPVCGGDGIVVSEQTAAVDAERRLRAAAAASRSKALRVELPASVATILIGPGASRLAEIEALAKKRFFIEQVEGHHLDHFRVLQEGTIEELTPEAQIAEGDELEVKLVEIGLHDLTAGVAKQDGLSIEVGGAASLVGKKVKVRIERVLDGIAYATVAGAAPETEGAITAETEAEKPTRQPRARKATAAKAEPEAEAEAEEEGDEPDEGDAEPEAVAGDEEPEARVTPKKRTRRGSRGGRRRRKPAAATEAAGKVEAIPLDGAEPAGPRIHVPDPDLGRSPVNGDGSEPEAQAEPEPEPESAEPVAAGEAANGGEPATPARKRTRRGSRGGRNRRRKTPAAGADAPPAQDAPVETGTADAAGLG
jgi:ribonuclease G